MFSNLKSIALKLKFWFDRRILGKRSSSIKAIPVFIEGEDPIENRTEFFISTDEGE